MHLVMLQAMLPAAVRDRPHPRRRRRSASCRRSAAPGLGRAGDGGRGLLRPVALPRPRSAETIDADTARRIETLDAQSLDGGRACGFLAIKGALEIAAERDLRVSGLHLATSADVGADASRVVGYGAFAFEYSASARLAEADRELLLSACMAALGEATRNGGKPPRAERELKVACAFTMARDFRHPDRERPTARLHRLARAETAAHPRRYRQHGAGGFADPRFPPLRESDLPGLRLDVSILSHPRPIPAGSGSALTGALEPDRDGLILGVGRRRALFLPSVWRQLPDPHAFVRHLVAKAGLESTGWPEGLEAIRFRVNHSAPRGDLSMRERSRTRSPALH